MTFLLAVGGTDSLISMSPWLMIVIVMMITVVVYYLNAIHKMKI